LTLWTPVANAQNLTNETYLKSMFITIDPIEDKIIGDEVIINGTTNLPITENLTMIIYTRWRTAMKTSVEYPHLQIEVNNISIVSSSSENLGINHWSVNITDDAKELVEDKYDACVFSLQNTQIFSCTILSLFSTKNATNLSALEKTKIESPSQTQPQNCTKINPATTQRAPLPVALPFGGILAIVLLRVIQRKKCD